jgi:glycosyltransferase involved in cell wall biosynthesis
MHFGTRKYSGVKQLTIVTVCRNAAGTLPRTIMSVAQNKPDTVEYIIVDGASTDGTIDEVSKNMATVDMFVSEPDTGIYDAMNKGLALATGQFVWFLNADDWLSHDAVSHVLANLQDVDYLFGIAVTCSVDEAVQDLFKPAVDKEGHLGDLVTRGMFVPHPATIVSTKLARSLGFDSEYRIAGDYDFMIRLYAASRNYTYLPRVLTYFRSGGVSGRPGISELFKVQDRNLAFLKTTLDSAEKRRRYYKYLLVQEQNDFYRSEVETIRRLQKGIQLPALTKIPLLIKRALKLL